MRNYPYLWFSNIIRLLEKREYSTYRVLLFSLFVGSVRLFSEWALGGEYNRIPLSSLATVAGFYWLSFFVITLVLRMLVDQPWRISINVILVGVFLGIFPPIIDYVIGGSGFKYSYVWDFPGGWRWLIYNPEGHITIGETVILWAVIVLTTVYVRHKTMSLARTIAACVLAYGAVIVISSVTAVLAETVRDAFGWPGDHRVVLLNLFQVIGALIFYLLLQPKLLWGLTKRVPHVTPFLLFCFLGSAVAGTISETTVVYACLLFLAGLVALGQNDYFDYLEDDAQGRKAYLDLEDVRFLTITSAMGVIVLATANTAVLLPAVIAFAAFALYNFPFYRAKRYFPSNLKIEGIWGLSAFSFGIVAAIENKAFAGPRWWSTGIPVPLDGKPIGAFDGFTIISMILAFGGFSLVSALKDYKDWEADSQAGVQTLYTIGAKRGWDLEQLHLGVLAASAVAVALAPFLLAANGRISWLYIIGGVVTAVFLGLLLQGKPSAGRFRWALLTLTLYFAYLILALSVPFPS